MLAQALMEAEVSAQIGAEHSERTLSGPPTVTATGPGTGTPGPARSSCRSPGCARAAICPRSWSPAGGPSGRWPRWWPSAMWRACRPGGSRTSPARWGSWVCPSPRSPGCAASSMSWSRPGATGPWTPARTCFVWLDALVVKVRERGRVVNTAALVATGVNADGHREILGLEWARPRTARPGRRSCAPGRPRPGRGQAGDLRRPPGPQATRWRRCWTAPPGSGAGPISCATCWSRCPATPSRWWPAWSARSSPSSGQRMPGRSWSRVVEQLRCWRLPGRRRLARGRPPLTCWPTPRSRVSVEEAGRTIPRSDSTARSAGAPTWSGSFPTRAAVLAWSAPSWPNSMTSGWSPAATWRSSHQGQPDHAADRRRCPNCRPRPHSGGHENHAATQLHHLTGRGPGPAVEHRRQL